MSEAYVRDLPDTPYYQDAKVREQIDTVLHTNVKLFQNLGTGSTKTERQAARVQERKNLRAVKHLDPAFIGFLLDASDE